jgi:hypothetical protein
LDEVDEIAAKAGCSGTDDIVAYFHLLFFYLLLPFSTTDEMVAKAGHPELGKIFVQAGHLEVVQVYWPLEASKSLL